MFFLPSFVSMLAEFVATENILNLHKVSDRRHSTNVERPAEHRFLKNTGIILKSILLPKIVLNFHCWNKLF